MATIDEPPEVEKNLRVFVRIRPQSSNPVSLLRSASGRPGSASLSSRPTSAKSGSENGMCTVDHRIITLNDPGKGHRNEFVFDRVFGADTRQEALFKEVGKPLVEHAVQGNQGCCFAYGQTGSGKTYTMSGKENSLDPGTRGLIPLSAFELFKVIENKGSGKYAVSVSLLEIYHETVRDLGRGVQAALLATDSGGPAGSKEGRPSSAQGNKRGSAATTTRGGRQAAANTVEVDWTKEWTSTSLDVMEDPSGTTVIKDITYIQVTQPADVMNIMQEASKLRRAAATQANNTSGRSHTVFTLNVTQQRGGAKPLIGRLHLVDLAGSERPSTKAGTSEGARAAENKALAENKAINKSLSSLGKVVMALAQGQGGDKKGEGDGKTPHVPYRDSKLTRILKNSLQGNCMTHMLAALNPASVNAEECFNTLQFAVRCLNPELAPRISPYEGDANSDSGEGNEKADELAKQVALLQEELDYTHNHYQKMMDEAAGPNWSNNAAAKDPTAAREAAQQGAGQHNDKGHEGGYDGGKAPSTDQIHKMELAVAAALDEKKEAEVMLARKKADSDRLRDGLAIKDKNQLEEIRRLKTKIEELTYKTMEMEGEQPAKIQRARNAQNEEVKRLTQDNTDLRAQLAQVTNSVSAIVEQHTRQITVEQQSKTSAIKAVEHAMKVQVEAAERERARQVDNLKQQYSYFLEQRAREILKLQLEISTQRNQHELEAKQLRTEVTYLGTYAERVTELLRRVEAGVYDAVDLSGVRELRIPAAERAPGLDPERLQTLRLCGDNILRLVKASRAASGPRPLSHSHSRPLPSRPHSASGFAPSRGFPLSSIHPSHDRPLSAASPARERPLSAVSPSRERPHSAVSPSRGRPLSAVSSHSRPVSAVSSKGRPLSGVSSKGRPLSAKAQQADPTVMPVPVHGSIPLPAHGPGNLLSPRVMSPTSQQRRQHLQQQQQSFIEEEEWILQEEESHEQGSGAASLVMRPAGLEGNTSEQAMQYMRSLEATLVRQRAEAAVEKRKQGDLIVALRSAQRTASRAPNTQQQNPIQAALNNTLVTRTPEWGLGHTHLSLDGSEAGLDLSNGGGLLWGMKTGGAAAGGVSRGSRPVSAGPRSSAPVGGCSPMGSMQQRPTTAGRMQPQAEPLATSMDVLTSGFIEKGLLLQH